jgi:hypothetical protein
MSVVLFRIFLEEYKFQSPSVSSYSFYHSTHWLYSPTNKPKRYGISGSHDGKYEDESPLGFSAV